MKGSWFPILLIAGLLGLLVLLASLQYQWLGQISDAEQVRLESRLKDDTKRFADDFNKEIRNAYFTFQFNSNELDSLGSRYEMWKEQTTYPKLIEDFHYLKKNESNDIFKFNEKAEKLENGVLTDALRGISSDLSKEGDFEKFSQKDFALIVPIHKSKAEVKKLLGKMKNTFTVKNRNGDVITENIVGPTIDGENVKSLVQQLKVPTIEGFLIIKLNESVIKENVLPDLAKKYFSQNDGGSYKLSITDRDNKLMFQTHDQNLENSDAQARLLDIKPSGVFFFARETIVPELKDKPKNKVIISSSVSKSTLLQESMSHEEGASVDVEVLENEDPNAIVKRSRISGSDGYWTLRVQHTDGSLEQFITNTRRRNLAISFGILSLLAVSIILIFLSSQRVKSLAQKQMDFVSSVSHEFRTPLAVIYSASENLSDGVIDEPQRISNYGNLIKREGKKLSGMVEQILEFAGANSGKRKYDFRDVEIQNVIDEALAECQSFIDENDFIVEKDFDESLPNIYADEKALTLAIQNLINNSLKYSNGSRWLKISAQNGDGNLKISVADKGIGISAKDKKQIFEPFYRAENVVDEQISGNGLGLSLVKQIIDAHGGKIEVESVVGKGSEFIIHLPLNK